VDLRATLGAFHARPSRGEIARRRGKKQWVTEVIAETVQFLDAPSTEDKGSRPAPGHPQPVEADDESF